MNPKKLLLALVSSSCLTLALHGQSAITIYEARVTSPTDGGSGPTLFYSNASLAAATTGHMTSTGSDPLTTFRLASLKDTDFFGNPNFAFRIDPAFSGGSGNGGFAISGSGTSPHLSGSTGSVSMLFKTPSPINTGFEALINRGAFNNDSNPYFEVRTQNGNLAIGHSSNTITNIGTVSAGTWYFLGVSWNQSLPNNQMSWFFGELGTSALNTGSFTITGVGPTSGNIHIGGRASTGRFTGALQQVAVYDRTLTSDAMGDKFSVIPEPSTYALLASISIQRPQSLEEHGAPNKSFKDYSRLEPNQLEPYLFRFRKARSKEHPNLKAERFLC
jgi:hypothetical protein